MKTIDDYFESAPRLHESPVTVKTLFERINVRLLMLRLENPRAYRHVVAGFRGKLIPIPCHYVSGSIRRLRRYMTFSADEDALLSTYGSAIFQYFKHHEKNAFRDTQELDDLFDGLTTVQICARAGIVTGRGNMVRNPEVIK